MNKHPISVDRCLSGGYILATMINGVRFKIRYIDYSLAEAKRKFRFAIKAELNK